MKKILFLFFIVNAKLICAQNWIPGNTYFNGNTYVEYIFGNLPVIISAPHGGTLQPTSIPNRTDALCGMAVTTVEDTNTDDLARALDTSLRNLLGCRPHTIISRLHRIKLDMNREINEATCGNTTAQTTWYNYHAFIDTAKKYILSKYGRGLFIDLHGHGHTKQRLEIGYLLTASELRNSDTYLNSATAVNGSSIKYLVSNNNNNNTHVQLIKGNNAFGTLMANSGYPSVPSQQDAAPLSTDDYFSGGYNTDRWGSVNGGIIDAFQIECNYTGIRNSTTNLKKFADTLASVIKKYLEIHFFTSTQLAQCQYATALYNPHANYEQNLFVCYPNPTTSNNIQIRLNKTYQNIVIKIIDAKGGIVLQKKYNNTQLLQVPAKGQLSGLYCVQVQTERGWATKKIIIHN